jgi:hypothetical protein
VRKFQREDDRRKRRKRFAAAGPAGLAEKARAESLPGSRQGFLHGGECRRSFFRQVSPERMLCQMPDKPSFDFCFEFLHRIGFEFILNA